MDWQCVPFSTSAILLRLSTPALRLQTDTIPPCSGHVSAITVSPSHRRLGLASMMMDSLEAVSEREDGYLCVARLLPSTLLPTFDLSLRERWLADPVGRADLFSLSQRRPFCSKIE